MILDVINVITNWSFALFLLVEVTIFGGAMCLVYMIWLAVIGCFERSEPDKAHLLVHLIGRTALEGNTKKTKVKGIGIGLGLTILILVIAALAMYVVGHFAIILSKVVNWPDKGNG